ncbi:hypothetical protein N7471_010414 [Penicillium samsonianum]|uniref:uncharacterized protein n=1 Tax=Penicillium samsonianum TaxID=1882272 RepID=UPI0025478F2B|nr:uncharacterized protein N7471_010414 [Penicillium samsonianum]KAJ6125921.1 hypothetical protein N7471_010414 [Penicillium samsonianum]
MMRMNFSERRSPTPVVFPITYTPVTKHVSKAKKGKRVHACDYPGCSKVSILSISLSAHTHSPSKTLTRAEHLRRHKITHNQQSPYPRRSTKDVNQSTSSKSLTHGLSMVDQLGPRAERPPHTKRSHNPAITGFNNSGGAYKLPPIAAFKPPTRPVTPLSVQSGFVKNVSSQPSGHLSIRRRLTFDSHVPIVSDPGSLPSPLSDTTLSLPSSRSCSPFTNWPSKEIITDNIT